MAGPEARTRARSESDERDNTVATVLLQQYCNTGRPSFHSWIQGARRLTLGSRVSVVSLVIPYSGPFFRKIPEKS